MGISINARMRGAWWRLLQVAEQEGGREHEADGYEGVVEYYRIMSASPSRGQVLEYVHNSPESGLQLTSATGIQIKLAYP